MKSREKGDNRDSNRRISRVEQEVQKTIAQFLISGFRFPLPGLVTISRVMMPGDLRTAKVYISVLGTDSERESALQTLQERAFEVQNYIGKELRMRFCPKLTFYMDHTTEHVLKIDRILHELEKTKRENKKETLQSAQPESHDGSEEKD